ncbi:MAG TPA: SURF1 family protein [Devosia sp.]|nr:SURF1 family protein [Devosia sp.]
MFGLLALVGVALLVALGVWQLDRLGWKLKLIAEVDSRVHAAAVPAPGPAAWPGITQDGDEYRHVTATGHFLNNDEALVQAVTDKGAGYWVVTPLATDAGFTVLVNRGFVPSDRRDPATRQAGQIAGETRVTGLLRITEPGGGFLRANDPKTDHWYSRDVAAIAAARGLSGVAPYFIDADDTPNPGGLPIGGLTVIDFPNNHLVYALTWFALALMLAGMAAYILFGEWKRRRQAAGKLGFEGSPTR